MKLAVVAAVAGHGAIGHGNALLFRDAIDQRHFRAVTIGHPVVMGRRTWQSLPERFRPLPGRRNLVLSRDPGFAAAGAEVYEGLDAALAAVRDAERVSVLGGSQVYASALPRADELVLTEVERDYPQADTFFPPWDRTAFEEVSRERHVAPDGTPFAFVIYRRRR